MSILDIFRPKKKAIGASAWNTGTSIEMISGSTGWRSRRTVQEVLAAYNTSPWFQAVVQRAAYAAAIVPWRIFATKGAKRKGFERNITLQMGASPEIREKALAKLDAQGRLVEITDHKLLEMLANPNPILTGVDVRLVTFALLFVAGECGWALELNAVGAPIAIWPIPPHWIVKVPTKGDMKYVVQMGGLRYDFTPEEFILFRNPSLVNPYGRGTGLGVALSDELENDEYISKFQNTYFRTNGRPDLLVVVKPAPGGRGTTEKELEVTKEKFENKYRGAGQGRSMWTRGDITITEISQKLVDLDLTEQRTWLKDLIRQVIGVPPEIMGDIENSNRATITGALAIMAIMSTVPQLEKFRAQLQQHLVPMYDVRLALGYASPVPTDKEFELRALQAAPWAATRGEIRKLQGLEDRGEPDNKHYVPMGLTEIDAPSLPRERVARTHMELLEKVPPAWRESLSPYLHDVLEEKEAREDAYEKTHYGSLSPTKAVTASDVDQIVNVLTPEYLDFAVTPEIERTIEEWGNKAMADVGVAPAFNMLNPAVLEYVEVFSSEEIVDINDTTKDRVRRTLEEGILDGEGADELARRLRDQFSDFSLIRSAGIARTEVNTAANFATFGGHVQSGVVESRKWSTALDGRARDEHVRLHDQERGIDKPFEVDGHRAMYPGDFASASLNIQCRCSTYAVITNPKSGEVVRVKAFNDETEDDQKRTIKALQGVFDQQLEDTLAELRKVA
jgi:HK97 family phage portal protein